MAFRFTGKFASANQFAMAVGLRALGIGALAFLFIRLLTSTQLYATALLVAGVAALIVADLMRVVNRFEHRVERFLDALSSDVVDIPIEAPARHQPWLAPFERTVARIDAARANTQRQLQRAQALLDTVSAALFILHDDGRMSVANRAANRLVDAAVVRLDESVAIGSNAASLIVALKAGARRIIKLANGQTVLASAAQFYIPGQPIARLISLQRIAGELDMVEQKAWEDMARVLAHEMMNSLTPIASLSESLETLFRNTTQNSGAPANDLSIEITGALESIRRRSNGLMKFVERYREVAELPAPHIQMLQLASFIANIEKLMSATMRDQGIRCTYVVAAALPVLRADAELLEQAVINLLRNAIHAVADSLQPRIEVHCESQDNRLLISIADNGRGLPENVDQIFVPFFTTNPSGSGIGLNVARHIALAHGGTLVAQANLPQGAIFNLTLPLMEARTN